MSRRVNPPGLPLFPYVCNTCDVAAIRVTLPWLTTRRFWDVVPGRVLIRIVALAWRARSSRYSEKRQPQRASRDDTAPVLGGWGRIEDLSIGIDLFPAIHRVGRARTARRRFGRNSVRGRNPAGQEGKRLRTTDRAALLVVNFFAIQHSRAFIRRMRCSIPG